MIDYMVNNRKYQISGSVAYLILWSQAVNTFKLLVKGADRN